MTNADILTIYKSQVGVSNIAALRAVWNAGWYEGKGTVPTATSPDQSLTPAAPVAVVTIRRR